MSIFYMDEFLAKRVNMFVTIHANPYALYGGLYHDYMLDIVQTTSVIYHPKHKKLKGYQKKK